MSDAEAPEVAPVDSRGRFDLRFEPAERKVRVPPHVMLFDAASWNGIAIDSTCGGHGTCRKCKVRILEGAAPITSLDTRAFTTDELRDGWRLACRVEVVTDLRVDVPALVTRPKAATVGVGRKVILRPAVQKRYVELTEPTLSDQRTDLERLLASLDDLELRAELAVLRTLGRTLRAGDYKVTAVVIDDVLIDVEPGDTTERIFGVAFDLGTTTVVATLLDLTTGAPVGVASMLNKQQPFGADVITRISAIMMRPDALGEMTRLAHEALDELVGEVCEAGDVERSEVYEVALAGNATMTHIALGIDPEPLGVAPFIMSTRLLPEVLAAEVGVHVHERARAVIFPAFGAYVGGDILAGLLASGMDRDPRVRLFLDIGTNCELVLGNSDRLLATAAPAGPAFEGAAIRCGMRAAPGAIEVVRLSPDDDRARRHRRRRADGPVRVGLVDVVAELVELKLIDSLGPVRDRRGGGRPRPRARAAPDHDGRREGLRRALAGPGGRGRRVHIPVPARRARAAVRQGRHRHGVEDPARSGRNRAEDVAQVLLAGSFGSYLSPASAVRLGLVPHLPTAADPQRRERRRRGGQDVAAQHARARGSHGVARGGGVCRALRPR